MPYTDERKTTRFVDFAFGIPRYPVFRKRIVRGCEDCWGQWSFRRSDFVSASTRTETTTGFSLDFFYVCPVREFRQNCISQLNIHNFQEEYLRSARNPQDFPKWSLFFEKRRRSKKTKKNMFTQLFLRLDPSRCLETWWRNSDSVGWLEFLWWKRPQFFGTFKIHRKIHGGNLENL